ncbi:MAG: GNAT family N-acetyltransferase [Armatimonadota bacterium]|nr:GNAT family N-acetyltransferase [Armatimonadota bacterium]
MAIPREVSLTHHAGNMIRPATSADIPEIVAIWGELAFHHARLDSAFAPSSRWQEEYRYFVRGLLGRDDALAVVAVEGDRVVGYGVGRISILPGFFERRRRGYIHDVVTRETHRRRGIGRRLVEALLRWMRESDVSSVELTVAVRNAGAVAFWERMGFTTYMHHMKRDLEP